MKWIHQSFFFVIVTIFTISTYAEDSAPANTESLESRLARLEQTLKEVNPNEGVKGSGIKITGILDTSYITNLADRANTGPIAGSTASNTGRVFDKQYNAFNLNALYLGFEKQKDNSKFPVGFRVVTLYGQDATVGAPNDSGFEVHHAYIDLGIPVGNSIDVKIGKLLPLIGYESSVSLFNWQFSRSEVVRLTPAVPVGAMFSYVWNQTLTTTIGVINGIDSVNAGASVNFTGSHLNTDYSATWRFDITGPKVDLGEFNAFFAGLYGSNDTTANTSNNHTLQIWNIGGTWAKPFGVKPMTWALESMYRRDELTVIGGVTNPGAVDATAVSAYGKWDWNQWFNTSGRFTYSFYNNVRGTNAGSNGGIGPLVVPVAGFNPTSTDLYSFTLTQGVNVWKDTLIRLEWRHDWTLSPSVGFGAAGTAIGRLDDIRQEQDTIAVNFVYTFL